MMAKDCHPGKKQKVYLVKVYTTQCFSVSPGKWSPSKMSTSNCPWLMVG